MTPAWARLLITSLRMAKPPRVVVMGDVGVAGEPRERRLRTRVEGVELGVTVLSVRLLMTNTVTWPAVLFQRGME